ncbi:hypothetical protein FD51_GL000554 [Lacticaseibacillus zeae DSM 20178 = KCTC 3804]|uniref:Uncharacterized protein n=1 Tax=Lacticaseibacillus zeae DSM 20178 = KCTC 3804 TaxID=1423816 RepID=A0A0R1ET48_LACZE|nr:hypothetical protein FD51_GL000554 [Lacticaseibacillus zeae DSM 20178 = KCTC 3804]
MALGVMAFFAIATEVLTRRFLGWRTRYANHKVESVTNKSNNLRVTAGILTDRGVMYL